MRAVLRMGIVHLIFGWKWPIVRVLKFYPFEKQLSLLLGKLISYGKWGRTRQTRFIYKDLDRVIVENYLYFIIEEV